MPRLYQYFFLVVLLGCSSKKDQVGSSGSPSQPQQYTGNAANGKALYTTCAACHGDAAQGNRKMNAPSLANADDWYLNHQLKNFKNGLRGYADNDTLGVQMAAMAKTLKDTIAMADVVAYIKTFPQVTLTASIQGDLKKGERTYQSICGSCHGQNGKGNKMMNAPRLNGIDDWYLKRQIGKFKNNIRGAHPDDKLGAQMVSMAALLTDEEAVNNIIAYLNSTVQPASK
jgi:cytochrome c oxidase subunit 2